MKINVGGRIGPIAQWNHQETVAPMSLIVAAVEEVAMKSSMQPKLLWKHVFQWAKDLQSPRKVWT